MDNIIKKCNLGIAVQEAMRDLDLEREKAKIMETLRVSFMSKYEQFKKENATSQGNHQQMLKGESVTDNEYPIGEKDGQQYFRGICFQAKIDSSFLQATYNNERRHFTLVEGYSRNDDSKKRQHPKSASKNERKPPEANGRKRNKKDESSRRKDKAKH